jgi:hypothetical protein
LPPSRSWPRSRLARAPRRRSRGPRSRCRAQPTAVRTSRAYWTNDSYTPLERPAEFAGKSHFTPQERRRSCSTPRSAREPDRTDVHYDDAIWQKENYTKEANLRTSLITDPANGLLPR